MTVRIRRFTKTDPCPICGGHDGLGRGQGVRCFGYYDRTGRYARCTREEKAGGLSRNKDGTYSHRLRGPCRCGQSHGDAAAAAGKARPAAPGVLKRRAEQRFRSYFTLAAYLRRRYGDGTKVRSWIYRDADGQRGVPRAARRLPGTRRLEGQELPPLPPGQRRPLAPVAASLARCRSTTSRPSSPPRRMRSSPSSKARNAPTSPLPSACRSPPPVPTVPRPRSFPTGRRWPAAPSPSSAMPDADGMGYVTKAAALLAALDPPARVARRAASPASPTARTSSNGPQPAGRPGSRRRDPR